jgi:hypothetical protein
MCEVLLLYQFSQLTLAEKNQIKKLGHATPDTDIPLS